MTTFRSVLLAIAIALAAASSAAAHQPWFNRGTPDHADPYELQTELEISQVVFGGFTAADQIDFYQFTAPAGFALDLHLVVADHEDCRSFKPAFTIIGPGIGTDEGDPEAAVELPESVPQPGVDAGIATVHGDEWIPRYEQYSRVTFIIGPSLETPLVGGEYLVAVWDPEGAAGSYGLSFGGEEVRGGQPDFQEQFPAWADCAPQRDATTPGEFFEPDGFEG
jgi:hypothetical protein